MTGLKMFSLRRYQKKRESVPDGAVIRRSLAGGFNSAGSAGYKKN